MPIFPSLDGPDDLSRSLAPDGMLAAQHLADELVALRPTAVVSSPYLRAIQTVEPTASLAGLEIKTSWELREWDSGLAPTPDYAIHYARSWADLDFVRAGGESLRQLTNRAVVAVRAVADLHPDGVVLIGSHGTFIARLLAGFGVAVDWPFSRDMPMPAIYRLRLESHGGLGTFLPPV
jgi:2,3-bisphosphoglycerate-dependent phosphoglycerate mutase